MRKIQSFLKYFIAVVITVGVAYLVGVQVAGVMISRNKSQQVNNYYEEREVFTREALSYLKGLNPGDTIPDHQFEDIDQLPQILSHLVDGPTSITFFDPECESCQKEMISVTKTILNSQDLRKFIYIANCNRDLIKTLIEKHNLQMPILFDQQGAYTFAFELYHYPFTVIVDEDLVIREAIAAALTVDDIKRISNL